MSEEVDVYQVWDRAAEGEDRTVTRSRYYIDGVLVDEFIDDARTADEPVARGGDDA